MTHSCYPKKLKETKYNEPNDSIMQDDSSKFTNHLIWLSICTYIFDFSQPIELNVLFFSIYQIKNCTLHIRNIFTEIIIKIILSNDYYIMFNDLVNFNIAFINSNFFSHIH